MSDGLDQEIERARDECRAAERALVAAIAARDVARARLEAFELAAKLRPPPQTRAAAILARTSAPSSPGAGGRGRQPGAISRQWRAILLKVAEQHALGANESDIVSIARERGLVNIRPKDVRDRMNEYQAHGYVKLNPTALDGHEWIVTEEAIKRFGDPSIVSHQEGEEEEGETTSADVED